MKTDRELLELAAKAAELNIKAERVGSDDSFLCLVVGRKSTREKTDWNPLDITTGDALRLAVKLGIQFEVIRVHPTHGNPRVEAWVGRGHGRSRVVESCCADDAGYEAATCRAIVRAAAEIGAQMKEPA